MRLASVFIQVRTVLVTVLIGLVMTSLALLTAHYGMKASQTTAENDELKTQLRDLVLRLAEVEGALEKVSLERKQVDEVTLSALGAVLDSAAIDAEQQGKVYVASRGVGDASKVSDPMGPPATLASFNALIDRMASVRERATRLAGELKDTSRTVSLRQDILAAIPSRLPAKGWLSSTFGMRNSPFHTGEQHHNGLDVAADEGTPVYATADGVVAFAGLNGSYGKFIKISHGFGITTRYAHNNEILVKKGQKVRRGEQIGVMGSTGRSTGPHVHYEVHVHNEPVDPARFVLDGGMQKAEGAPLVSVPRELHWMGGEPDAAAESALERQDDAPKQADEPGLFAWTRGERLILAASLPAPLGRATTTDVVMLAALLLLLTVASSLVKINEPLRQKTRRREGKAKVRRAATTSRYELSLWGSAQNDDD